MQPDESTDPQEHTDPQEGIGPGPQEGIGPGPPPAMPLAEPGQRLVARIIDMLVVGVPVVMVAQAVLPRRSVETAAAVAFAALLVVYETVQLALWGRTLGKRAVGLRVVSVPRTVPYARSGPDPDVGTFGAPDSAADGDRAAGPQPRPRPDPEMWPVRLGAAQAFIRAATYALPIAVRPVPVLGLLAGFLWLANAALIFEGTDRLALHDRLARTKVVARQ